MAYDVARVRGLYVSLSDGWTYLNAHESVQIPEKVSAGVATAFRTSASVPVPEPSSGSHARAKSNGVPQGALHIDAARSAIADLLGSSPGRVVLGPNRDVLLRSLALAMQPRLRRSANVVLSAYDEDALTQPFSESEAAVLWSQPDLGSGHLPAWQYRNLVNGSTRLVVLSAAHRLLGTLAPIGEIADIVHAQSRAWVFVDASAYAPYRRIDMEDWGADIVLIDVAALGGPQCAALVFRDTTMFPRLGSVNPDAPIDSPRKLELGAHQTSLLGGVSPLVDHIANLKPQDDTEDVTLTRSARVAASMNQVSQYTEFLALHLVDSLRWMDKVHIMGVTGEAASGFGVAQERLPRLSFLIDGVPAETVHERLLDNGLVTTLTPHDNLLWAMGSEDVGGTVTVAMAMYNTTHDIDQLTRVVASLA